MTSRRTTLGNLMRYIDLTGQTFNRLTVLKYAGPDAEGRSLWHCLCECGNKKTTKSSYLKKGRVKSCGCMSIDQKRNAAKSQSHPLSRRNKPVARRCWQNMIARCTDINGKDWPNYGGRGITVCERWLESFANFFEDMGDPDTGMTLDRIDANGPYSPENCRWATRKEQGNNRRNNRWLTVDGQTMTMAQWAEHAGISWATIQTRLSRGWGVDRAVTEAVNHK